MLLDVCGFFDKNKKIQQTPDFIFFTLFILVQSLQSLSSCFKDVCLIFISAVVGSVDFYLCYYEVSMMY
jgi:hypothetical protein